MDSCLETIRNLHEERERLLDITVKEKIAEKLTHKAKVNSEQRVKTFVDVRNNCYVISIQYYYFSEVLFSFRRACQIL